MGNKRLIPKEVLDFIIGTSGILLALALIFAVMIYITPPSVTDSSVSKVIAAKVGELPPNSSKIFRFGNKPAILINTAQGVLKAFSAVCTHLNCTVQYAPERGFIWCACHNGKYDLNGKVISGPPPRPLEEFKVNVAGEDIIVSKR
jgi:cytochrome b6-f complex iron-sulfur subunit